VNILVHPYKIKSKEDLYRLSQLASEEDYPIYISTNSGVMIDARSVLALFTILGQEVNLVAPDHANANDFMVFLSQL
jgi:hypothetical protein